MSEGSFTQAGGPGVHRVSQLATLINGYPFDSADFSSDADVPLVRIRDLAASDFETFVPRDKVPPFALVRNGDVVIGMDGEFNAVLWNRGEAALNQRVCLLRARPGVDSRYIAYAIPEHLQQINDLTWSTTVKHLAAGSVRAIRVPARSEVEQRAIADFLDRETAQIDAFIAKNEQLITLLTERRAAIASRAMAMTFPEVAVRHLVRLIQTGPFGSQIHTDDYISGGWPLINPMHMIDGRAVPSSDVAVSDQKAEELRRHRLREGDLVVARRGELGRSALIGETDHGFLCGTGSMLVRPVPSIVMPRYLQLAIGSERSRATLTERSVGSTMDNLNAGALSSLRVPLPPLEAQRAILAQVDQGNGRIDAAMEAAKRSNRLARERRAALISAAVTGKIDVGVSA